MEENQLGPIFVFLRIPFFLIYNKNEIYFIYYMAYIRIEFYIILHRIFYNK